MFAKNGNQTGFGAISNVPEEVFLTPSGKHRCGQYRHRRGKVGRQDRRLMAAIGEFANLAQPEIVG